MQMFNYKQTAKLQFYFQFYDFFRKTFLLYFANNDIRRSYTLDLSVYAIYIHISRKHLGHGI